MLGRGKDNCKTEKEGGQRVSDRQILSTTCHLATRKWHTFTFQVSGGVSTLQCSFLIQGSGHGKECSKINKIIKEKKMSVVEKQV